MGVQHGGVEKLIARFRGETVKTFPTTISCPLISLMPLEMRTPDWILTGRPTDGPIIEEIVDCAATFGMEYVLPRVSLPALTESLATDRDYSIRVHIDCRSPSSFLGRRPWRR